MMKNGEKKKFLEEMNRFILNYNWKINYLK